MQLLSRWNARMNLTAVRAPKVFAGLHLGECLRAAQLIPAGVTSVLDFGSGAGLPGIPIQVARPELAVTLAESQTKKASFLRECVRELRLLGTHVYAGRVEELPAGQCFDLVAMRAVDRMESALAEAKSRIGRFCLILTSTTESETVEQALSSFEWAAEPVPVTKQRVILLGTRMFHVEHS